MHRQVVLTSALVAAMAVASVHFVAGADGEDPAPTLVPAEPEPGASGPRVVQSWTGSAIYVQDGWSLEVLKPEPDLAAAAPGDAWEAMRLTSPLGERTCSLYVAVAEEGRPSLGRVWAHTKPRPIAEPRWDLSGNRPALLYPIRAFSLTGALDHPRSRAVAITLVDGSVLILGGVDRLGEPIAQAELWVPPAGG